MKNYKAYLPFAVVLVAAAMAGCSTMSTRAAGVADSTRSALDRAGFKDVTVAQDRAKGVVTLGGQVAVEGDKAQAEAIARSLAGNEVVSNEIAVVPPGFEGDAKMVNSDLDKGIESNLHAALVVDSLEKSVQYTVKNHVVTLTGHVNSEAKRARAEGVASAVPNVHQVVNELQVTATKATSTR